MLCSGSFLPGGIARIFVTFNSLFGNFLSFSIPLIILGLVTPAIGDLGKGAGRLLALTALIAYGSTIFSGFFTYFSSSAIFPHILPVNAELTAMENPEDFMVAALFHSCHAAFDGCDDGVAAFVHHRLGLSYINGGTLREAFSDFQKIIVKLIEAVIIPLLPLHIFGIFLNMTVSGQVMSVITMFLKVIIVIFVLHVLLLLIQFTIAGSVSGKNPLRLLKNMLPAYATALGTQSSAATIPVTLAQAVKNGVRENIAIFVVPLWRHHPSVGQHDEDHGLRDGDHVHVGRACHFHRPCRVYHDAGRHDGRCSGCTGRGYYGRAGVAAKHVRVQRDLAGIDDRPLYRDG